MRLREDDLFVTDNGNYIADLHLTVPVDIEDIKQKLDNIDGIKSEYVTIGNALLSFV